jgi:hypothetical protein
VGGLGAAAVEDEAHETPPRRRGVLAEPADEAGVGHVEQDEVLRHEVGPELTRLLGAADHLDEVAVGPAPQFLQSFRVREARRRRQRGRSSAAVMSWWGASSRIPWAIVL